MRILLLATLIICTPAAAEEPPDVSCYDEGDATELAYTFDRYSKESFAARFKHFAERGDCWEGERETGIATTYQLKSYL
ncbi:hypothetical protein FJY94_01665 [Candidatus Kaiserbacteria bacterium]|nr:hypothetical protein [Candidatus Kaiserbacteria bacterium]